jgi:hypothetical protein
LKNRNALFVKPRQSGSCEISLRQPGGPSGTRGFPRLLHLWSSGPPTC